MGLKKRVIHDYIREDDYVTIRASDNDHFVVLATTDTVKLDAGGAGELAATLLGWLAARADRL